jgi:RNA polymerase sigma-70 factor (ECF subfamily)
MDPDRHLVRLAKGGNKAAFGKLARRYRDQILALTYDFLKDNEKAKDAAEDVFMKAFRNIGDFGEKSHFSSWIFRIAVKTSLDTQKSMVRPKKYLIGKKNVQNVPYKSNDLSEKNSFDVNLSEAIVSLSDQQQTAIILRYFHKTSVREIADILDCTEHSVRAHLHRAFQKLDKSYKKRK